MKRYLHFKGGNYVLLNVGRCRDENEFYAIYCHEDGPEAESFPHDLLQNYYAKHSETGAIYHVDYCGEIIPVTPVTRNVCEQADESGVYIRPLEMFLDLVPSYGFVRRFHPIPPELAKLGKLP